MDTPTANLPPLTCREVMESFFPAHAWHTATSVERGVRAYRIRCSCDYGALVLLDSMVSDKGWKMADITKAMKNLRETPLAT